MVGIFCLPAFGKPSASFLFDVAAALCVENKINAVLRTSYCPFHCYAGSRQSCYPTNLALEVHKLLDVNLLELIVAYTLTVCRSKADGL